MNKLTRAYWTVHALGVENIPRRIWQIARSKLGLLQHQLPGGELSAQELAGKFVDDYDPANALSYWKKRADSFFVSPKLLPEIQQALKKTVNHGQWDKEVTNVVKNLKEGRSLFFSHFFVETGWPINFNHDPVNKIDWPLGEHFSYYKQFDPNLKDIKCIWELSRFSLAYYLARQYTYSLDESSSELFWQMFKNWDDQNPYGLTAQWACGQESTFRMMGWLFAAIVFLDSQTADTKLYHRMTELIWYTGHHIEFNINYALAQKNNHSISEAVGLFTIGLLFTEFKSAQQWKEKALSILKFDIDRQIYEDGSYVQHSFNYHRLMMDDILWAGRLGQLNDSKFDHKIISKFEKALNFLIEMTDLDTGRVANYGSNDGANILPLSCCDYLDYRSLIQAAHYFLYKKRFFELGAWDEKMVWLFGPESLDAAVKQRPKLKPGFAADTGGYYILRGPKSKLMTRCHSYCDRPFHADMLHVDLSYKGHNILRDGGSYMYYCDEKWQKYFIKTAAHNTIEIDNSDQMVKGPRFLWLKWIRSKLLKNQTSEDGRVGYFSAEHYGYSRLAGKPVHRRSVLRIDDSYLIIDDILGKFQHEVALRWRLLLGSFERNNNCFIAEVDGEVLSIELFAPGSFKYSLVKGQQDPVEGWESLYYGQKEAVETLLIKGKVLLPVSIVTLVLPSGQDIEIEALEHNEPNEAVIINGIEDKWIADSIEKLSAGRIRCK